MEFSQIAVLLVTAAVFGILAKALKQPSLIGYLLAGILAAAFGFVPETRTLESLGRVGVTFLLFFLGLEMNIGELGSVGKVATLTGIGQIVFTFIIGFFLSLLLGFGILPSVYIAIALAFSSTIIMVKLLSQKKDLSSLYGRISIGFLLIQNLVAVLILMFFAGFNSGDSSIGDYGLIVVKASVLFVSIWVLSKKVLPYLFERFKLMQVELLFIVCIAWALGFASFVAGPMGLSLEIGGLLAGIALSNLGKHLRIATRTRPLRDFFLAIFFLFLGTKLVVGGRVLSIIPQAIIFSLFVLVGNPLIVSAILGFLGYRKRTSLLAGLTTAQISEFSFILMAMGTSLGHTSEADVSLVVLVGVITMTASTYLILKADRVYGLFEKHLSIFERRSTKESALIKKSRLVDHVVIIGCDRTGESLIDYFREKDTPYLIVDFNPRVSTRLTAENFPVLFGDISDPDILEAANIRRARMVISTLSNLSDNLTLLKFIRSLRKRPVTIFTSSTRVDAIKLYEVQANYVIVPEVAVGDYIVHFLKAYGTSRRRLIKAGKLHFDRLIFK